MAPPVTGAAIYTRVSTDEQAEGHSLEFQDDGCTGKAVALGENIVERHQDAGFSAKTDPRPEFQRAIADAEAGKYRTLIVYKFARFARSRRDSVVYKHRLKKAGVRLISVTEPLDDSPAGL